jgi:uncharacterized phage protein gp47/JayE
MSTVDENGFSCDDLATIFANLQQAMLAIFPDASLGADTVDGQTLGIYAESKADSDQLAQDVYNSFNPQTATGVQLSRIVQYNGVTRIPGQPSQGTITCSGTAGTHIPIGSLVACVSNNEQFATIQDGYIDSTGAIDIAVRSVNYGAVQGPAGTITQIVTPVWGWQTVTNAQSVILGRDEETDEELRLRRAASTATPAQSVPDSVYGAIANIPQVVQVRLYENYTEQVDPVTGLPPHSFSAIVEGGADQDIANAIWNRASIGATQVGNVTVTIHDVQSFPHDITFARPQLIRTYLTINVHPLEGWGDTIIAQMQTNISQWSVENWLIGDSIIFSRIYEPINEFPNVFSVKSMFVDTASPPANNQDITIPYASMAMLAPVDIVINKV